jgi:hypothetical protein
MQELLIHIKNTIKMWNMRCKKKIQEKLDIGKEKRWDVARGMLGKISIFAASYARVPLESSYARSPQTPSQRTIAS